MVLGVIKMSRKAVNTEYLSDVWTRINSVISEQEIQKYKLAKQCGFDRKLLSSYTNITITYFARICEELNVSADFFLFGLDKAKEKTDKARYIPDKCYEDMMGTQELVKESKKLRTYKGNILYVNNTCGATAQKELMVLADDFGLLHREDVQEFIENCKTYEEGHKKIMKVYEEVYM